MPRTPPKTRRTPATNATRPRPATRGSRSGRPVMQVLDILGRRWALRIGWELRSDALSFNDLQRACDDVSPSVLSQRLREGLELGTIDRDDDGRYRLTAAGRSLSKILGRLDAWAQSLVSKASRTRRRRA